MRHKHPLKALGWIFLRSAFGSITSVPKDFVQVFEVVLNLAWFICWQGNHKMLSKTLMLMSAVSTILSTMVWDGLLSYHDMLVQLNVFIARVRTAYSKYSSLELSPGFFS